MKLKLDMEIELTLPGILTVVTDCAGQTANETIGLIRESRWRTMGTCCTGELCAVLKHMEPCQKDTNSCTNTEQQEYERPEPWMTAQVTQVQLAVKENVKWCSHWPYSMYVTPKHT